MPAGEDTDLAMRARAAGAPYAGAPELLTYHAVEPMSLGRRLRTAWRWGDLAYLVRRHPGLRRECYFRVFWRLEHAWLVLGLAGAAGARRRPALALLALPWIARRMPAYGPSPRGRLRALSELPSRVLIDLVEVAALARGSARHRTLFL